MSCNNCNNSSCDSTCGCPQQVKGSCVFYQGANLTCLDVTKGDDYDSILANLNTLICDIVVPSGIQTTVSGCSSITVTKPPNTNNYTICLSTATQTQITSNTANIASLSNCVNQGVLNVVSNDGSVNITVDTPSTGCGKILNLSVPPPSGLPAVDGIIYSNSTKVGANTGEGTANDLILKSSGNSIGNYYFANGLNVGDEIRWRANGQIHSQGDIVDSVKYDFRNGSFSIINGAEFTSFSTGNVKSSWQMEGTATILDNTPLNAELLVSVKLFRTADENSTVADTNRDLYIFNQTISGVDLSNLILTIKYNRNVANSLASTNFARQLVVEIRKLI